MGANSPRNSLLDTLIIAQNNLTGWHVDPQRPDGFYCDFCDGHNYHTSECINDDLIYYIDQLIDEEAKENNSKEEEVP